ncbi:Hypothetical protein PP7435_CHR2-1017 [Komagataella phaffii CBS 7435]|uniref:Uncharacterized protein n=2 Tax=Komagataella phaffii TaxID=460519 RepID=C4R078_KOMPG|nr:Hypothetical protein PAS_chr2-1_0289 [Komagataella phaffii GS115]AOA61881.1 GQ67_00321T0 [Komagataella phaffii]CAH2448594.1 Hypothetical protein BQ9382_C2-5455 [Komagataella phaffii CBS 7435]AOA68044.1 GQ68_01068T0 [Komagataella phaffii GS115]CAY68902.1 Hypothetical protein PAS_chr2-1_0289 [Komagataella phaffii GS115]CCA38695.1 Hypothetical protein PP7435_CHR2-1017 [Komagataella phaffii CBS 7435]
MFYQDSIQSDDKETLRTSPLLYQFNDVKKVFDDIKISSKNLFKIYASKDSETFYDVWRINGDVPERSNTFYSQFPRKPSNLDTEHHYEYVHLNHYYIGRWLPDWVLTLLFPMNSGVKLTGKGVPTRNECVKCQSLNGRLTWDKSGNWSCVDDTFVNNGEFFESYREFLRWRGNHEKEGVYEHQTVPYTFIIRT